MIIFSFSKGDSGGPILQQISPSGGDDAEEGQKVQYAVVGIVSAGIGKLSIIF